MVKHTNKDIQGSERACQERCHGFRPTPVSMVLGTILFASGIGLVAAQETQNPSQDSQASEAFKLTPLISLTSRWDDNIYGQNTGEVDDQITNATASIKAASQWKRHRVGMEAGVSADFYADNDTENVTDWWVDADGRYDLSAKSHALAGVRISQNHEDRSSPDAQVGAADPTTYVTSHGHVGFAHYMAPFTFRVGAVFENLNFKDGSVVAPPFDVNQRDRDQYSLGMRFSYQMKNATEVFFQAATDTREYDMQSVGRDSDGYRLGLGLRADKGPAYQVEGFIGHMVQDYDAVAMKDVSGLYYGLNLKWKPAEPTQITGYVDRSINETTLLNASSHLDTTIGGRVEHKLNPDLSLNANLAFTNADYQGVSLDLDEVVAGFGARYYFSKNYFVAGDYRYINRDANNPTYEYTKNLYLLSIGYSPRPR